MAKREKQRVISKKHMARQEREELQKRYITYATIAVVAIVVILVGVALVDALFLTPNRPVATVNSEEISTADYQARAKFERSQLVNQAVSTYEFMNSFGDESALAYFQSSLQQIVFQLTPELHGQSVLDTMIDDELIRQEAELRGITVSEAEIDKYIAEAYGYFPDGTPTAAPTSEPLPTSTLSPQQLTLVPPTATSAVTETVEVEPTPTEAPESTPTEVAPTPTVYTEEAFKENYDESIDGFKQNLNITEEQFRSFVYAELLRNKMLEEITKYLPQEDEQVWARHILVETEEEAQSVIARLSDGEDFAALAQELSTDTGSAVNGGDLGWFGRGQMVPEFETAAFELEIGEISDPVQSQFGYHIIQKLGHELRPVDDASYNQLQQTTFNEWLTTLRAESDIESDDTWKSVYPETPLIPTQVLQAVGL